MFEKYDGVIPLDKVLYDTYHFSSDKDNLQDMDFIEYELMGKEFSFWILYEKERYLFKELNYFDYNVWGDLLSEGIAKELDIPCAEHRIGILQGKKGILSKSFLTDDDTLIHGSDIFEDYYQSLKKDKINNSDFLKLDVAQHKKDLFRFWNNIEKVFYILNHNKHYTQEEINDTIFSLEKMLLFDLITLQGDRHPDNWGIIEQEEKTRFSPLFDNSVSFGLGDIRFTPNNIGVFLNELMDAKIRQDATKIYSLLYRGGPSFTFSSNDLLKKDKYITDSIPNIFLHLLEKSDFNVTQLISEYLYKISKIDLTNIIHQLEIKNGIKMDDQLFSYVINIFEENFYYLNEIFIKYKEEKNYESKKNSR